jgi:tetratricopeptide (TPR) repeat protein
MDSLGTITKYYPFVDLETKSILESTMEEVHTFSEFVQRISETVTSKKDLTTLAHIAAVLADLEGDKRISGSIEEIYEDEPMVKPWTPLSSRKTAEYPDVLAEAITELMNTEPPPWILMELHILHAMNFIYRPESTDSLLAAKNLMKQHPELECFAPQLLIVESIQIRHEGDLKKTYKLVEMGLESARKYNDIYFESSLLLDKASMFMSNLQEALEITESVYKKVKHLGMTKLVADTLVRMGFTAYRLGEYDLALRALIEAIAVKESLGQSRTHYPSNISEIFSDLGDGEHALEWAQLALSMEPRYPGGLSDHICPHVAAGRALIHQGRMNDALLHVEKARDIARRSGLDRQLAQYYLVAGEYEIACGNILSGMQMVEDALDIFDKFASSSVSQCLLILTGAEINLLSPSVKTETTDSGLWMLRLEKHARKNNLTGILMQHALLKAKMQRKLGKIEQSIETLQNALELSNSSSVKTLRNQIVDNIQRSR